MSEWTNDELTRIGEADELQIETRRHDGTLRKPVTIWVVRHGDDLYIRSYKGNDAAWYRGTQDDREGRIHAGGVDKDVTFEEVDRNLDDMIDDALRMKYRRYDAQYVDPMVTPTARTATVKIVPR